MHYCRRGIRFKSLIYRQFAKIEGLFAKIGGLSTKIEGRHTICINSSKISVSLYPTYRRNYSYKAFGIRLLSSPSQNLYVKLNIWVKRKEWKTHNMFDTNQRIA